MAKVRPRHELNNNATSITPMLRQYMDVKARYPDAILFFRMGDFYEMFFEDAECASRILEITLTSRDKNKESGIPMCGVPVHSAEGYLTRLVQSGRRVAICEQVEDPKKAKGLVRREVVRVVTPGLLTSDGSIEAKSNNFLAAIQTGGTAKRWGLSCLDISTGEFRVTELSREEDALTELFRLEPTELLMPETERDGGIIARVRQALPETFLSYRPDAWFFPDRASAQLKEHFRTVTLDGFGLAGLGPGVAAAGALLSYLIETQKGDISHIRRLKPYHLSDHLIIDEATKRNLELVANAADRGRKGTLLDILDLTVTPMGGRLLRHWILYPLRDLAALQERLLAVETLRNGAGDRSELRKELYRIHDVERLVARTVLGTANARDLLALKQSLARVPGIKEIVASLVSEAPLLEELFRSIDVLEDVRALIERAIRDDCAVQLREGRLIKEGFDEGLDELVHLQRDGRSYIAGVEARERERTGIQSIKIGFNRVFGYYLEVSRTHAAKVPGDYIRKQTLVGAERYITPELKEIESKILTAQEQRLGLEYDLFQQVRAEVAQAGGRIQETAAALARLDCLAALAEVAERNNYTRPRLNNGRRICIRQGRHPVVERTLKTEGFVPNDVDIGEEGSELIIITGPNMAGKSTVLRQTALICIMAQMGSCVPAEDADIGIIDQVFTRVGATDYLSKGQSTFMVEMSETANILHNASNRSLVILDEIGRGTSTYDGLAIAWAVAEHLLQKDTLGVKTLFATHYHELTDLTKRHKKVRNMHVAVKEWGDSIVFLRRLLDGATDRSYGIQVAALAGIPQSVIDRATEVLARIEKKSARNGRHAGKQQVFKTPAGKRRACQMALPLMVDKEAKLKKKILSVNVNEMTPLEALNCLAELQTLAEEK
jgi:DNA mismatch repair protein MutS